MDQLRLQPPEQFDFKNPDNWPRWKRRFQQFRVASGLAGDDEAKQISTLLYCLGEQAEAVLDSTDITADERKVYDTVVAKLDGFFQVRRNVIFERARFNRRNQQEGEGAEHYIMTLYELAAYCEYRDLTSEMIRDRLVVGIRDSALSKRLQLDPKLTLETAKKRSANTKLFMSSSENSKECNRAALKRWQVQITATGDREDHSNVAGELFPSKRPQVLLLQSLAHGVAKAHTLVRSVPQEMLPAIGANEKDTTVRSATRRHRHLCQKRPALILLSWTQHSWTQ